MQTFLPYCDFIDCALSLDNRRLGKQRVECKQILLALRNGGAWANHPAVKMWRGYESALQYYGECMCREWMNRGFVDNLLSFFTQHDKPVTPHWLWGTEFRIAHRRVLICKGWWDAIWAKAQQHPEFQKGVHKKSKMTHEDYMVWNDYVDVDWQDTWYGRQWPGLLPATPVDGSFPYVWPVK